MGYGYASSTTSTGLGFLGVVFWGILICYLVAWVLTMGIVTKAAKEKGYDDLGGKLWFIGLFGLVFTPAIIVAALPDRRMQGIKATQSEDEQSPEASDELPDL